MDRENFKRQINSSQFSVSLIDLLPGIGVVIMDFEGRFLWTNGYARRLSGLLAEELEQMTCYDLLIGEREFFNEKFRQLRDEGEISYEHEVQVRDGRRVPLSISCRTVRIAGEEVIFCVAVDISERKHAEDLAKESRDRLYDIIYSSADWHWDVDSQGNFTYCAGSTREILGYSPEELIGKNAFELMAPAEAERLKPVVGKLFDERRPIKDLENLNLTKEGKQVWLLTNGVPCFDEQGVFIGYRGVDKDITPRKIAEKQLRDKLRELELFNKFAVDREKKMVDLKNMLKSAEEQIKELKLKKPA